MSGNFITDNHCRNVGRLCRIANFHLDEEVTMASVMHLTLTKTKTKGKRKWVLDLFPFDGIAMLCEKPIREGQPCTPARDTMEALVGDLKDSGAVTEKQAARLLI